jgi:hypothetical protein
VTFITGWARRAEWEEKTRMEKEDGGWMKGEIGAALNWAEGELRFVWDVAFGCI